MFLYDMLNSKHTNLKNTVSEVNKTVKEVEETKREAEAVVSSFQKLNPDMGVPVIKQDADAVNESSMFRAEGSQDTAGQLLEQDIKAAMELEAEIASGIAGDSLQKEENQVYNNNDRIRELYRKGKSNVEIAKELGLGVGEVKLVIDLYKNM